jgi:hypothetical protein
VITLLGLVFLVPQTPVDLVEAVTSFGSWFWPVLLLVVGIAIMVPVFAKRSDDEADDDVAALPAVSSPGSEATFGEVNQRAGRGDEDLS